MQVQPSSTTAPLGPSPPGPGSAPAQVASPVNPQVDLATHYPNGLPRSINGLTGKNTNGNGSASPVNGTPAATTPVQPSAPSPIPATSTSTPVVSSVPVLAPAPLKPMVIYTPTQPPQSALPRQHLQRHSSTGSTHKISIVDPPGLHSAQPRINSGASQGFPSPKKEHQTENPKFIDDFSRLTHAMQQSVPSAVRRVIRDNWEKCLLGSEFHHAFLLNAVIHHSNGVIIRRSIKDFGAKMVAESKREIIEHLQTPDLEELADVILDKASDYFLDKALERRLRTIDARSLINALARAERLGYENSDILDDQKETTTRFNPAPAPFDPSPNPSTVELAQRAQLKLSLSTSQLPRASPPVLHCPLCWRRFESSQPYEYHVQKQVCTKEPPNKEGFPFSCKHCGAGFITKVGQQYHIANNVCGDHGTIAATPKAPANAGSPITLSSGNNSPVQPPLSAMPRPPMSQQIPTSSQYASTPVQPRISSVGTPSSITKDQDPYAHLNPSTLERLNEELRQAEINYSARFKEAEAIADPTQRQVKLDGLQNSFSTKQSIIRKKYGVRLRNRRTKAEIDNERQRMGLKHASPNHLESTPSAKRPRTDDGSFPSSQVPKDNEELKRNGELKSDDELKSNHLAVSDMKAGLGGSSATAATTDPTLPKPAPSSPSQQATPSQQNSLSSLQRKGYRVSSHHPQANQVSPTYTTMENSTTEQNGSASAPVVVDEASSDSESDGDIPNPGGSLGGLLG